MKIIKNLIANIVVCGILLFLFDRFWIGISIDFVNASAAGSIVYLVWTFLVLWFVFWVFNSPIKRILKTLSFPVNFITLWLVSVVINVLVFYLFAFVVNNYLDLWVAVKLWAIWQTLILSVIMWMSISVLTKIL